MIAPVGATSITEAVRMGAETYQALKRVITKKFGSSGMVLSLLPSLILWIVVRTLG